MKRSSFSCFSRSASSRRKNKRNAKEEDEEDESKTFHLLFSLQHPHRRRQRRTGRRRNTKLTMNLNLKAAGTLLSRAKQFTEEKFGQATDRTEYQENFEGLLISADRMKFWTERLASQVETLLQPNPNERLEDFILTKLDQKTHQKPNRIDQLALCMNEAGHEFGPSTPYGSTLIKSAQSHLKLGLVHKDFVQSAVIGYIQPLKSYLEGEMKSITKERRTLEMKRLDLDATRSKMKKNRLNSPTETENEVRQAQGEFDRQYHITGLMLDGLNQAQNHHVSCLYDFIESELQYHQKSLHILEELHEKISGSNSDETH